MNHQYVNFCLILLLWHQDSRAQNSIRNLVVKKHKIDKLDSNEPQASTSHSLDSPIKHKKVCQSAEVRNKFSSVADINVNVNVTDTILWQCHHDRVMQLNWLYFCGICQMMSLKVWPNAALGCNHQSICMPQLQPFCSAALVPNVLPRRDEGSGKPCAAIEA